MNRPSKEFVKKLCDEFCYEWPAAATRTLIFDYLSENPELDPAELIKALVPLEIRLRQSAGEDPRARDYADLGEVAFELANKILDPVDEDTDVGTMETMPGPSLTPDSITEKVSANRTRGDESRESQASQFENGFEVRQPDEAQAGSSFEVSSESPDSQASGADDLSSKPYVSSEHGAHPKVIGRYRLLEEIGNGGMGSVWCAEQREPVKRMVALKVIRADFNSKDAIARFEAERQAIALMDHPNIAKILDAGQTKSGNPFFVMELVNGIPLNKYCDRKKLGIRERLELMLPVCRAVQHAHQKGIIHRDLKHSNVLVTESDGEPVPKVIDFGLAKALGHQGVLTKSTLYTEVGKVVGTIQYMSPEQAASSNIDIDTRSDVYSLGVMIYKLLTGATPLESATVANLSLLEALKLIRERNPIRPSARLPAEQRKLDKISSKRQVAPDKLRNQISGDLDWIVMKALEIDRADRYQTANGLALDIERYLNDEAVNARPPSTVYLLKKFVQRNRRLVAALGAISFLLIAGIIATSATTLWALAERETANETTELWRKESDNARRAEEQQRELQIKAEVDLQALRMKSAWSNWKSGDIEDAVRTLGTIDDSKAGWEREFLRAEFNATEAILYGHARKVRSVDVSDDGKYFASTGSDHSVKIWNANDKTMVHSLLLDDIAECVRFSPDSKQIAVGGLSNQISIWDVETGEQLSKIDALPSDVLCLAYVPASDFIVVGLGATDSVVGGYSREKVRVDLPASIHVISLKSLVSVQILDGHADDVLSIVASSDGKMLISGSNDAAIRMWEQIADGKFTLVRTVEKHFEGVTGIAIAPSGEEFCSSSKDGSIRVWRMADGELIRTIADRANDVNSVDYSPDGERILSCSSDGTAIVRSRVGEQLLVCKGHFEDIYEARFFNSGKNLLTGAADHTLRIWNSSKNPNTIEVEAHGSTVWAGDFSNDSKTVATASEDGTVAITDVDTGELVGEKLVHEFAALCLDFAPHDDFLVTAGACPDLSVENMNELMSKIYVWDPSEGKLLNTISAHRGMIWDVKFSPNGELLATASVDTSVKIWNVKDWSLVADLNDHLEEVASVRFSADGKLLLTASDDKTVKLWDTSTWGLLHTYTGHDHAVWRAVFSPDGKTIASTGYEGSLIFWSVPDRKMIRKQPDAHEDQVAGVAFSPDGKRLVTASDDRRIKVWDVESGVEFLVLRDNGEQMVHVSFSPDGTKLLSGNSMGLVTIRSTKKQAEGETDFLPSDGVRLVVDGLKRVVDPEATRDTLLEEAKKSAECCKFFPSYRAFIVHGIAQYRLGEFEKTIESMREARRLEPIEYGDPDVRPDIEGYLCMALFKTGHVKEAQEVRDVFDLKRVRWIEDDVVNALADNVKGVFESQ